MSKFVLKKGFISQKIGQKITIFDGEKSVLYTFNPVASYMFEKIKQGLDEGKIIKLLTQKYEVSDDKAGKDVKEFLEDLKKKKVI